MKKTVLVTGASRGIGRAVAVRLADEHTRILINFRSNEKAAQQTLDMVRRKGGEGELLPFDVSDADDVHNALHFWQESHPDDYIASLIHNAGITSDALLLWMEQQEWHRVVETNLNSFFYLTKAVVKDMVAHRFGRIVSVVSLSGQKGMAGQTNYAAAKAGVIGATKSLALEVARKQITVNAVAPGFIATDMTAHLDEKELRKQIPMRRFGTPEEVAGVVAFLLSEEAGYITGQTISVNGGLYT